MRKVLITADSVCDLGQDLKDLYGVKYYPYHIILEDQDYQDGIDINPDLMFEAYYKRGNLPQTSAINTGEYIGFFTPFVEEGYDVVHFCLGSSLSSAYEHCLAAADQLGHVQVIDSCSLSAGIGLLIIVAGDMMRAGEDAETIAKTVQSLTSTVHASFILDTLDFLCAGGRCSSLTALLASAINIKPCIEVNNRDGSMDVGKRYRGKLEKVHRHYVKDQLSEYDSIKTNHIFITHSGIEEEMVKQVKATVQKIKPFDHVHITRASCTISSHCGPRCLGILFLTEPSNS